MRFGFTDNYVRVALPADETSENEIVEAELSEATAEHCVGRVVHMHREAAHA
jgi:hypothetical protein